ncbi:capsular synthesis regulator component B [Enterobacter hormaechei]|uniref:LuxR C-terminal-related transcriptional regulator n=1 Tax=Enterobacter hormaechei TaxID=158836 RepID=UPI0007967917|nr:LuxR C-terminal-related transcriptional regulator [Enterobacter hormaechei]CZY16063.1 capsular synthesis regulator component B [Enterobacter hormaechei]
MDNISVVSDNVYASIGIRQIASHISHGRSSSENLVIYTFEKTWLHESEFYSILNCKAERILILASKSLLNFFSSLKLPGNITFGYYDLPLAAIQCAISSFYDSVNTDPLTNKILLTKRKALSPSECNITLLYIRGLSVAMIARLMNRSYKTISAQKRSAMEKMGIVSDVDLMQKKQGILLANKLDIMKNNRTSCFEMDSTETSLR